MRNSEPILIRNATVVDSESIRHSVSICIEGNRIVGLNKQCSKSGIVINGENLIATPSFYVAHTHLGLYPVSKIIGSWSHLDEWASSIAWRWEPKLTPLDSYYSAIIAVYDYIGQGIGGIADMHFNMDSIAEAVYQAGIRANLSVAIMNRGFYDSDWKALEDNMRLYKLWNGRAGRIKVSLGPCTIRLVSRDILEEIAKIRTEEDIGIHMHVDEVWEDEEYSLRTYGVKVVYVLDKLGLLDENTILAHGVWLDDKELEVLAKYKVVIAHNPTTNMLLRSGIARARRMLQLGIRLGIGLDISPTQNIVDEVLSAIVSSRLVGEPLSAKDLFDALTFYGSSIFRPLKLGLIREGYLADIVLWMHTGKPRTSIYEDLLLGTYKPYMLIVNGNIIMENGQVRTIPRDMYLKALRHIEDRLQQLLRELAV